MPIDAAVIPRLPCGQQCERDRLVGRQSAASRRGNRDRPAAGGFNLSNKKKKRPEGGPPRDAETQVERSNDLAVVAADRHTTEGVKRKLSAGVELLG